MAEVIKEKYDLQTLCWKQVFVGCKIHFEDGDILTVKDYSYDSVTKELHVEWEETTEGVSLSILQKYVVTIPDTYSSVRHKKRGKKAKQKK